MNVNVLRLWVARMGQFNTRNWHKILFCSLVVCSVFEHCSFFSRISWHCHLSFWPLVKFKSCLLSNAPGPLLCAPTSTRDPQRAMFDCNAFGHPRAYIGSHYIKMWNNNMRWRKQNTLLASMKDFWWWIADEKPIFRTVSPHKQFVCRFLPSCASLATKHALKFKTNTTDNRRLQLISLEPAEIVWILSTTSM